MKKHFTHKNSKYSEMNINRYVSCIIVALVFTTAFLTQAEAQVISSQSVYNRMFVEHQKMSLRYLTKNALEKLKEGKRLDIMEMGLLVKNGTAIKQGNKLIQEYTKEPYRGAMFYVHDIMSVYLEAYKNLTPETRRDIRHSLKVLPLYRGDTENHFLTYYTGLYLAAQTWPDEPDTTWFNGKSSARNMREAKEYILSWINLTTTKGQGEFDSPNYILVYLSDLFTLYNHCKDPVFKNDAKKMLDYFLADYAIEYLKGFYCGGTSRIYPNQVVDPREAPSTAWGWLLFGDTRPAYGVDTLPGLWSDYHMPVIIQNIAADRSKPYEHYERKRVRNVIRYQDGKGLNPPVYKTDYMTNSYCLGSIQGGILQPIQQHTWDVTYVDGDKPNTRIFTLNPYYSGKELAMFFPEEQKWMIQQVARYSTFYAKEDKWVSSSPYERTFQYKNAIIVLYNIPDHAHFKEIDGFFPKVLEKREVDPSGWIFCQGGKNYIAVYPLKPYKWIDEKIDWRMRSKIQKNGVVLEVDQADKFSSFEAFKKQILKNKLVTGGFDSTMTVSYTASNGNTMKFTYPDKRVLNGHTYDLSHTPLFQGPYTHGDGKTQTLTITHGGKRYTINFGKN